MKGLDVQGQNMRAVLVAILYARNRDERYALLGLLGNQISNENMLHPKHVTIEHAIRLCVVAGRKVIRRGGEGKHWLVRAIRLLDLTAC